MENIRKTEVCAVCGGTGDEQTSRRFYSDERHRQAKGPVCEHCLIAFSAPLISHE